MSKDFYPKRSNIREFEENPFVASLVTSVKSRNKTVAFAGRGNAVINQETGEMLGDTAVIGIQKQVEKTEFIKLYQAGIAAAFDLSKSGQGVLSVLLQLYRESKNTPEVVYFNFNAAKKDFEYKFGNTTFTKGLNELLIKEFLAPVKDRQNLYWINPAYFFKGDRLRVINEYVVKSSKNIQKKLEDAGQQRMEFDGDKDSAE